jgi:hypothetical protein
MVLVMLWSIRSIMRQYEHQWLKRSKWRFCRNVVFIEYMNTTSLNGRSRLSEASHHLVMDVISSRQWETLSDATYADKPCQMNQLAPTEPDDASGQPPLKLGL